MLCPKISSVFGAGVLKLCVSPRSLGGGGFPRTRRICIPSIIRISLLLGFCLFFLQMFCCFKRCWDWPVRGLGGAKCSDTLRNCLNLQKCVFPGSIAKGSSSKSGCQLHLPTSHANLSRVTSPANFSCQLVESYFTCQLLMPTCRELLHLPTSHANLSRVTSRAYFSCQLVESYFTCLLLMSTF